MRQAKHNGVNIFFLFPLFVPSFHISVSASEVQERNCSPTPKKREHFFLFLLMINFTIKTVVEVSEGKDDLIKSVQQAPVDLVDQPTDLYF